MIDARRFPCVVGDVIVRAGDGENQEEAWLAGAIVLREGALAACVLFIAPEAGGDRAVYARARPDEDLGWLAPVPLADLDVGREPPSTIEIDGVCYQRARRLPMRASIAGEGAPNLGEAVLVGEYVGPRGAVAVVLAGSTESRAWRGVKLAKDEYEVWKSGERG